MSHPKACYWIGVALVLYVCAGICVVVVISLSLIPVIVQEDLLRLHLMSGALGMVGAAIAAMRKYYQTLITESTSLLSGQQATRSDWTIGWIYYYLTRPLLGAILGALSFTLSFVGLQILAQPPDIELAAEGRYVIYALSFLAGFSVSHVLDRLDALSREIFRSSGGQ